MADTQYALIDSGWQFENTDDLESPGWCPECSRLVRRTGDEPIVPREVGTMNILSEEQIFETISDPQMLADVYPDNAHYDWMIAVIGDNPTARQLALHAAEQGLVVGLWAAPFGKYCVGIYCRRTAVDDNELGTLIETAGVDGAIIDIYCGTVRILQMGCDSGPLLYPMLGAWNWGAELPEPIPYETPEQAE